MQVETYEVISQDPASGDNALVNELTSPEAVELITSLGLSGQEALLHSHGDDAPVMRNPYRLMTMAELHVYQQLFPRHTAIAEYRDGAIPLRVLQVAAHAGDMCGALEVWHPQAGQDDPLLVGRVKASSGWGYQLYILARWGVALQPFDALRTKAMKLWQDKALRDARKAIAENEAVIRDISLNAEEHFGGSELANTF